MYKKLLKQFALAFALLRVRDNFQHESGLNQFNVIVGRGVTDAVGHHTADLKLN